MELFKNECQKCPQLGLLYTYPAPGVLERIARNWDWVWIDAQHGELDYNDVLAAVRACNFVQRPAIVRVPDHAYGTIGRMLDASADGVLVPLVDTVRQAKDVVAAAKFPPVGNRSFGGRRVIDLHGRAYTDGYKNPLLIIQIESPESIDNMELIAEVEGIDGLFIGLDDMAIRSGYDLAQNVDTSIFDPLLSRLAEIAAKNNVIAGGVFTNTSQVTKAVEMGFTLLAATSDVGLLASGSSQTSAQFRNQINELSEMKTSAACNFANTSVY